MVRRQSRSKTTARSRAEASAAPETSSHKEVHVLDRAQGELALASAMFGPRDQRRGELFLQVRSQPNRGAVPFVSAAGFTAAHLLPTWGFFSDSFINAPPAAWVTSFSWVPVVSRSQLTLPSAPSTLLSGDRARHRRRRLRQSAIDDGQCR